jgi:F-type H+-transporting ATPase subunit b
MLHALLLAAEEGGAEEAASNPILPTMNELFWGAIAFGVMYLLVAYVLLPPIQRARNDRAATIQANKDAAESARAKAVSATAEVSDQLAGVRAETVTMLEQARAEAEAERQRLVSRADREVQAMKDLVESEIAAEREEAVAALRPQVADLAVGAASKMTGRQVDLAAVRPLVDRYLDNPN